MLPKLYQEEFTQVQALARFALEGAAHQPLLFIKADSHVLKFLVRQQMFTLLLTRLAETEHLMYAAEIPDDPNTPGCCWSLAETKEELSAIAKVLAAVPCTVALLNEQALPVCTATVRFHVATDEQQAMLAQATLCPRGTSWQHRHAVDGVLRPANRQQLLLVTPVASCEWREQAAILLTDQLTASTISFLNGEEGDQQEHLALWLMDLLRPPHLVKNPQVHEPRQVRELCDIVLSYEHGCLLLESKSLSLFTRTCVPTRDDVRRALRKHVKKAVDQLRGASVNIKRGLRVTRKTGEEVQINRDQPAHCIVLVPDLSLLDSCDELGGDMVRRFAEETSGFLNIVDPSELRGIIRNAGWLAQQSNHTSHLMAFDGMLLQRFKFAATQPTADLRFRMKLVADQPEP